MTCLHTINKSVFHSPNLADIFSRFNSGDAVLFLEDGVYSATATSPITKEIVKALANNVKAYYLEKDAIARGVNANISECLTPVNHAEFVHLTTVHLRVMSWY